MDRRGFLRSFAAFAAVAVAPKTLASLAPTDQDRLVSAMRSGVVQDQTFLLDGPIILDIDNLVIRNCEFIFRNMKLTDTAITVLSSRIVIRDCYVECSGAGCAIRYDVKPNRDGLAGNSFYIRPNHIVI